jgi:hypothetical protein
MPPLIFVRLRSMEETLIVKFSRHKLVANGIQVNLSLEWNTISSEHYLKTVVGFTVN